MSTPQEQYQFAKSEAEALRQEAESEALRVKDALNFRRERVAGIRSPQEIEETKRILQRIMALRTGIIKKFRFADNPDGVNFASRFVHLQGALPTGIVLAIDDEYEQSIRTDGQIRINFSELPEFAKRGRDAETGKLMQVVNGAAIEKFTRLFMEGIGFTPVTGLRYDIPAEYENPALHYYGVVEPATRIYVPHSQQYLSRIALDNNRIYQSRAEDLD